MQLIQPRKWTQSGLATHPLSVLREALLSDARRAVRSGLRGGISVAMALSLPASPFRETVVSITYAVVIFSVPVQGLTLRWMAGTGGRLLLERPDEVWR